MGKGKSKSKKTTATFTYGRTMNVMSVGSVR